MKAILVIDMPEVCTDCPLHSYADIDDYDNQSGYCDVGTELIENIWQTKPSWCPLKPLPKKSIDMPNDEEYMKHYKQGRNDVIAELKGEMVQNFCDEEIEK